MEELYLDSIDDNLLPMIDRAIKSGSSMSSIYYKSKTYMIQGIHKMNDVYRIYIQDQGEHRIESDKAKDIKISFF
jgi:hypothetical protein